MVAKRQVKWLLIFYTGRVLHYIDTDLSFGNDTYSQ